MTRERAERPSAPSFGPSLASDVHQLRQEFQLAQGELQTAFEDGGVFQQEALNYESQVEALHLEIELQSEELSDRVRGRDAQTPIVISRSTAVRKMFTPPQSPERSEAPPPPQRPASVSLLGRHATREDPHAGEHARKRAAGNTGDG